MLGERYRIAAYEPYGPLSVPDRDSERVSEIQTRNGNGFGPKIRISLLKRIVYRLLINRSFRCFYIRNKDTTLASVLLIAFEVVFEVVVVVIAVSIVIVVVSSSSSWWAS